MLHGHITATSSTSAWHHFKQDLLDLNLWRLWHRLCKKWALPDGTLSWALVSQSQHPPSIVGVLLRLARNCIEDMAKSSRFTPIFDTIDSSLNTPILLRFSPTLDTRSPPSTQTPPGIFSMHLAAATSTFQLPLPVKLSRSSSRL
jgi:hypothetical protein